MSIEIKHLRTLHAMRSEGSLARAETYRECGGPVKVIACIDDPMVIQKILTHLKNRAASNERHRLSESHAPPQASLVD